MLNSSDCLQGLFLGAAHNISRFSLTPKLVFFNYTNHRIAENQILFGNSIRASTTNGDFQSKLKIEGKTLVERSQTKYPARWVNYGGCIPSILQALDTVQDLDEALKPWEGSLNNKERTIILKEQSNWRRAQEIFDWFKRKGCYELNVIHYNIMFRIFGRARRWDLVQKLWNEMKSNRIAPSNSTYGTLINACCKAGLNKEALLWLGDMYKQAMEPDEVTMGIVVQMYKQAGEFQKAEQFFEKWSMDSSDAPETQRCYSLYTYNTLIDTYGKAGELEKASNTFAQMLRAGIAPDIVTFNTMIHVCGNHGCLEEVASLMAMMEELRCLPNTRTYNILISLYVKSDDIGLAASYLLKMKVDGQVPDIVSYRTLLYAYSIRNMVGEAEALVLEMEEKGLELDEYTQSALTRMYVNAGMLEQSWNWFERFQNTMSSECFSANIDAFGEHGYLSLAEKSFICCLDKQKLSVAVFNVMIKAYGIGKKYDKACDLFDSMENSGILPDKCTYNSLIQILSGAEMPHTAVSYVRKMQGAGLISDCIPYSMVMTSLAKLGELQLAVDLFNEMISFGVQPDIVVYSILINGFAEVGGVQEAMKYVELMKNAGLAVNSVICNSLIKLYTKVGYLREAKETFELVKSLEDGSDVYSSNCMIDLYSENDMVEEAEEIFDNLKSRGRANEFSYSMMLCLYKKIGQLSKGCRIAQEMQNLGLLNDTLSYCNVIGLYASDGRMKEAVKAFQHMLASGVPPNDATFRSLGVILLKHGVSRDAINHLELVRKKDVHIGSLEWIETLCSIVRLDYTILQLDDKTKGDFKADCSVSGFRNELGCAKGSQHLNQCLYG
ncbi:pentatricopeptide repeat-containing protein At3g23020 [Phoenix dactylifera]|uniref:Pentatricopeptide repeat-containing protein At3g23020 n=1 Tax=Phoenix dactylifera TaxID=42345 RepID=A0A8B8J0A5_PHODC|nr:pentatricopeptide repeat-containing protein At3g23020 [Phoenix dactylifera]XP_026657202.1 pentatricopeptide repeat-containing protein At3g23020 [Phoenix dactylifera]XP_026657203.1 pentatricopeptide repeat-containing protein At3g23020 [Phoenix dactylifera]